MHIIMYNIIDQWRYFSVVSLIRIWIWRANYNENYSLFYGIEKRFIPAMYRVHKKISVLRFSKDFKYRFASYKL